MLEIALPLLAAAGLGAIVGLDRQIRRQAMGLRTFILISTGSALFTLLAMDLARASGSAVDPVRVLQGLVAGIGVLGMGAILHRGNQLKGATTGASVWVIGSIGAACGLGYYAHAVIATIIVMVALVGLGILERWLEKRSGLED